jgi:hypothetical protein
VVSYRTPVSAYVSTATRVFVNDGFVHVYEVCPRTHKRGFDLISDVLRFGRLWYGGSNTISNAIGYAQFYSRSHNAVIRVYDDAGNVIETHAHKGESGIADPFCYFRGLFVRTSSTPQLLASIMNESRRLRDWSAHYN